MDSTKRFHFFSSMTLPILSGMDAVELAEGIHLFRGRRYDSNATAIVRGREAILIDGMGGREDAEELRRALEVERSLTVRFIVSTHYFSDHMAAFRLFPRAEILAHRYASQTFWSEAFRTEEEEGHFVEPTMLLSDSLSWIWGSYTLEIFHNPGHTMSTLNILVPEAGLLFAGDQAVGNIAYLRYSTPDLMLRALRRARQQGAGRVVLAHGGPNPPSVFENAEIYLRKLGEHVRRTRAGAGEFGDVREIPFESCLAPGVEGTEFERIFHERNLETVEARTLFSEPGARRPLRASGR